MRLKRFLEVGGLAAGLAMVAIGVVAIVMGIGGHGTVLDSIKRERIVGTPDMTPALIANEAGTKLPGVALPTCSVAGKAVDTGARARCFADYMRIHTLLATGGQTYAEMGRYLDAKGQPTSDATKAAKDPRSGQPVENGLRNLWVTETALTTALNTSYLADQIASFGVVVGGSLLLAGVGFSILAVATLGAGLPLLGRRLRLERGTGSSAPHAA